MKIVGGRINKMRIERNESEASFPVDCDVFVESGHSGGGNILPGARLRS